MSRIPAPIKSVKNDKNEKNENILKNDLNSLNNTGLYNHQKFDQKNDQKNNNLNTKNKESEYTSDYENVLNKFDTDEIEFNGAEDSLDDNSFGMFPTSPKQNKSKNNFKNENKIDHMYHNKNDNMYYNKNDNLSAQNSPKYKNIHDSLNSSTDGKNEINNSDFDSRINEKMNDLINNKINNKINVSTRLNNDLNVNLNVVYSSEEIGTSNDNDYSDNESHFSDLSNEELKSISPNSSKLNMKKKKKNMPWRALKPLSLKPFIAVPLLDI